MEALPTQLTALEAQPAEPRFGIGTRIGNSLRAGYDAISDRLDTLKQNTSKLLALGGIAIVSSGIYATEMAANASADPLNPEGNIPELSGTELVGSSTLAETGDTNSPTTTPDLALEQKCENEALARPSVVHPLVMRNAGIRPVPSYHGQYIDGQLGFQALDPECDTANLDRFSEGTVEEFENNHWQNITGHTTPFFAVNDAGYPRVFYAPSHSLPNYQFNDYMPGKGFHKVRLVVTNELKSGPPEGANSRKTVAKNEDIFRVTVTGNPKKAAASKRVAQQRENKGLPV